MPSAEAHRRNLLTVFQAALTRVNGRACVRNYLQAHPSAGAHYLIAVGKPAANMAQGAADALGEQIADGLVMTKHGHGETLPWPCLTSGHPFPDQASLDAGEALLRFIDRIPVRAQVLVLLSGGASALVERLPDGVTLEQLRAVNDWLLGAGLDINACNYVRKRISLIKGGRLAQLLAPRAVLSLIISDVPGNDAATVGSGPLVPDPRSGDTPALLSDTPAFVRKLLRQAPPIPRPEDPSFKSIESVIVATLDDAKQAAAETARERGYGVIVDGSFVSGDAVAIGTELAGQLESAETGTFHVWGGETQVTLPSHPGRGGRCQSLALAAALALRGQEGVLFLAAGTDGTDGPTDDAGAFVDGHTVERGAEQDLDAQQALERADAGSFLEATGDLLRTGPTGTNVMDLMLGLKY
ncbi:MAG: glycerate kinase [Acidiferrobacterales bacterium]